MQFLLACLVFASALQQCIQAKSVALVLRGESFRDGGSGSRATATDSTSQMQAYMSVTALLIEPLENKSYTVDVFSSTRDTPYHGLFTEAFGGRLKYDNIDEVGETQTSNAVNALRAVPDGSAYDWIVVQRHDMEWKMDVGSLIAMQPAESFLFPFQLTKLQRYFPHRVPDTLQVFAGSYLEGFAASIKEWDWPEEDGLWTMVESYVKPKHIGFLLKDEYADSSPEKYGNRLYKFCGLGEGQRAPQNLLQRNYTTKIVSMNTPSPASATIHSDAASAARKGTRLVRRVVGG